MLDCNEITHFISTCERWLWITVVVTKGTITTKQIYEVNLEQNEFFVSHFVYYYKFRQYSMNLQLRKRGHVIPLTLTMWRKKKIIKTFSKYSHNNVCPRSTELKSKWKYWQWCFLPRLLCTNSVFVDIN